MAKRNIVELTSQERETLEGLISKGRVNAMKQKRSRILLKADISPEGPGWTDQQIADSLEVGVRSVERTRQLLVEQGLENTLERRKRPRPPSELLLDGAKDAQLIALACGGPPEGYARWTLRLLADRFVKLGYVDSISHETVRQALKKTTSSHTDRTVGSSRPRKTASLSAVWRMS